MFWRMIFKSLFHSKKSRWLIALTTAIGLTLSLAMLNITLGVQEKMNTELKAYGANINILPKEMAVMNDLYGHATDFKKKETLSEKDLKKIKEIFWGFNIVDFAPYLTTEVKFNDQKTGQLRGTWFDHHLSLSSGEDIYTGIKPLKKWWSVEGEWLTAEDNEGVMLGQLFAKEQDLHVGDTIQVRVNDQEKQLKVKGIFNSGDEDDQLMYTNLAVVQSLTGLTDRYERAEVSALTTPDNELARRAARNPKALTIKEMETWYCTAYASSIAYQIQEAIPECIAKPIRKIAESEGAILQKIQSLLIFVASISIIGTALGIANLITANVMERRQEIGLKKALGAKTYVIILSLLMEITLLNLLGGLIGFLGAYGLTQVIGIWIFQGAIPLTIWSLPLAIVMIILVSFGGLLPTVGYLLRLNPTTILHGE